MKLTLEYGWDCTPDEFWALYFDEEFAVRLHLEALDSTSADIVSQEGDLATGLVRTLRYGQRPPMPGPVRKIFGEEVMTTEVSTFDPATSTTTFTMTPGTMADKTQIEGSIGFAVVTTGQCSSGRGRGASAWGRVRASPSPCRARRSLRSTARAR